MLGIDTNAAKSAWSWAVIALALWGFFIIRKTVLVFILSLMFAYLIFPLVEMAERRLKIRQRFFAVLLPFAAIVLLLVGAGFLLRGPVRTESQKLIAQVKSDGFKNSLAQWHVLGIPVGEELFAGDKSDQSELQSQLEQHLVEWMPQMGNGVKRVARDIGNVFIIPILSFFMLLDGRRICAWAMEMCFPDTGCFTNRRLVQSVLDDAHTMILQYMRALVLQCFAVLIVFGAVLSVMGVRYALLLALIAFPLEFVPLIGPLTAGLTIVVVCEFNQYPHIWWIVLFLIGYRLFQDYVLSPHLMKKSVELHPLLIIFGIFAGGEIGNIGGVFLSVPLLAMARLVFYEYRKHPFVLATPVPETLGQAAD